MLEKLLRLTRKARGDRTLEPLLESCRLLISERGQANVYALAVRVIEGYRQVSAARREAFFAALATEFSPDPEAVLNAATQYAQAPTAQHLAVLTQAVESPRQELIRRINRAPGGTSMLLAMRVDLLGLRKGNPELAAVDADFLHLLTSWFNPGFLRLERVDWQSSAALLEKIIHHEAVHEISGWNDLRRRLQPDRRCYAFFHPQLRDEPLIFVEVALVDEMADAVAPLIESTPDAPDANGAKTAVFYSISNCQPGLRGVSLGNFLIKKVAAQLKTELPQLKTFCTLSPIPGFVRWLDKASTEETGEWAGPLQRVAAWRQRHPVLAEENITHMPKPLRQDLISLGARFLVKQSHEALGDPVARFHLDNGARLERINFAADLSKKGLKQALGLMVNYQYDLSEVELRHQEFVNQKVSHSTAVRRLLKPQA
ncbi:decarboxylase [Hydrogenophaga crassostreae]|uniref:Decarboxylase n=1 Tax=Hydrogenophaga crassostreae TaxID=1763535 RepID=A0A163C952_9BURK|nr:malonyl-CoA decarboxylase [Hydrogenophaga crassostreae]AOW13037.1 decarboxylase [Hydrogenophaga crassostreae]OAD40221.1 decarboxylase [Hydrogenophaga crassostreae]